MPGTGPVAKVLPASGADRHVNVDSFIGQPGEECGGGRDQARRCVGRSGKTDTSVSRLRARAVELEGSLRSPCGLSAK